MKKSVLMLALALGAASLVVFAAVDVVVAGQWVRKRWPFASRPDFRMSSRVHNFPKPPAASTNISAYRPPASAAEPPTFIELHFAGSPIRVSISLCKQIQIAAPD